MDCASSWCSFAFLSSASKFLAHPLSYAISSSRAVSRGVTSGLITEALISSFSIASK